MRRISLFAALVVAMSAVSCVQDINDGKSPVNNDGAKTFEATFDAAASKAVLRPGAEESKVEWETGDQVSVLVGEGCYLYTAASSGPSTILSTEAPDVPAEGTFYAVYPYDAEAALAEGKVSTTLPAEQTASLGSFSTHLAVAQTTGSKLAFKNVCGLVKVTIDAENVTKVVFEGNSSEVVAGGINVTVSDKPSWEKVAEQGATSVTLVPAEGQTTLAKGAYYFAVLPQKFDAGFKVTAYKGAEASVIRNVGTEYTLERADIMGGRAFGIDGNGTEDEPYILKTAQDMVDMRSLATYGGETWFKMANDIDMQGVTNYIPVNNLDNFERKIHFDGGNFTISNFTCDDTDRPYPSLFGVLYGSVKDLNVVNATITSKKQVAGILGGYIGTTDKPAIVTNVTVQGSVTSEVGRSGGFAGNVVGSTFENCSADVTVNGTQDVGGFAGKVEGESSFTGCDVKAGVSSSEQTKHRAAGFAGYVAGTTVTFTDCEVLAGSTINDTSNNKVEHFVNMGGFIGYSGSSILTKVSGCTSAAVITAPYGKNVGGFVGLAGTGKLEVINSSSSGSINARIHVGGFIGAQEVAATVEIGTSSSSVEITATDTYVGGFAGNLVNQSGKTVKLTDCHATGKILQGSSSASAFLGAVTSDAELTRCYATGTMTSVKNNCAGIVGYIVGGTVKLTGCYYTGEISAEGSPLGGIVGINVNADLTIDGCYSTANIVTTSGGSLGGLAGDMKGKTTITDSYATGNITTMGKNNGGLVGLLRTTAKVSRCYATGDVNGGSYERCGGLIGFVGAECEIDNCYSTGDVITTGMCLGGIIAYAEDKMSDITITNSYSTGDIMPGKGAGGILGCSRGNKCNVQGCIAWNKNVKTTDRAIENYAPGAVVGSCYCAGTFKNCWRRSDMSLEDVLGKSVLWEMPDYEDAQLPLPAGVEGNHNRSYHGKAAASGATISSVALSIGWSEDIWDFTKDIPTLK